LVISDKQFGEFKRLTNMNNHTECYEEASAALGLSELCESFSRIKFDALRLGYLSHDLEVRRRSAYEQMLKDAKTLLSEDQYQRFYMCF
jgi:hypothetical protein